MSRRVITEARDIGHEIWPVAGSPGLFVIDGRSTRLQHWPSWLMDYVDALEEAKTVAIDGREWWVNLPFTMTWDSAVDLGSYFMTLGWRLPTVEELVSLFDYDAFCAKADLEGTWYWSCHAVRKEGKDNCFRVSLGAGIVDMIFGHEAPGRVLLVRD